MSLTDFAENEILDHILNDGAYTLTNVYLALSTTTPTDAGSNFTEPGNGYARVLVSGTSWDAAASGSKSNSAEIAFPVASGAWGTITHMGLFDASTAGNLLLSDAATSSRSVASGDVARFAAGSIVVAADAAPSGEFASTSPQSSVTKGEITWTFDGNYQVGQYVTGHYFVVDPGGGVTINSTTPAWSGGNNGTVVDPPRDGAHGWDTRFFTNNLYSAALSASFPLTVSVTTPGVPKSVVTAKSRFGTSIPSQKDSGDPDNTGSLIKTMECLTVVDTIPYADEFRPAYVGGSATYKQSFRESDIDWTVIDNNLFTATALTPSAVSLESSVASIWCDSLMHSTEARFVRPDDYQPEYGANQDTTQQRLLLRCFTTGYTQALVQGCVQVAIDYLGLARASQDNLDGPSPDTYQWGRTGGNQAEGKIVWPAFLAVVTNDTSIDTEMAAFSNKIWQYSSQMFQAVQADVDRYNNNGWTWMNYPPELNGVALGDYCWASFHEYFPQNDNQNRSYDRGVDAGPAMVLWLTKTGRTAALGKSQVVPFLKRWVNVIGERIHGTDQHILDTWIREMVDTYWAGLGLGS